MMRTIAITTLLVCALMFTASAAMTHTWVWNADNHVQTDWNKYDSMWEDGYNKMYSAVTGGNWNMQWDAFAPGVATITNPDGSNGRYLMRTNFVGVDDPNDQAKYWDVATGLTMKVKTWIDSEAPYGRGNILLGVHNPSTHGMGSAGTHNGFQMYWGWDTVEIEGVATIGVTAMNSSQNVLRSWIAPTTQWVDTWSEWVIGAKRIHDPNLVGDTIGWKVWLNGELLGADYIVNGEAYSFVGYQAVTPNPSYMYIGQLRTQPFAHTTHYDYVTITNAGVVPEPSSLLALATGFVGMAGFALRRRR